MYELFIYYNCINISRNTHLILIKNPTFIEVFITKQKGINKILVL